MSKKKNIVKHFSIAACMLVSIQNIQGQDVHFSQFYENGILRNPALIGIQSGDYKVGINYRNQWSSLSTPFRTALLSGETKFIINRAVQDYMSIAITQLSYKAGQTNFTNNSTYVGVNYNKSLDDVSRTYLSLGFAASYTQRSYDFSKMTFSNQFINGAYNANSSSREQFINNKVTSYDVGTGITLNGSLMASKRGSYYVGFAAYNLLRPREQFNGVDAFVSRAIRYTSSLGFRLPIAPQLSTIVYLNYQNQYPYEELIGGVLFQYTTRSSEVFNRLALQAGCLYRLDDAIIPTIKLDYSYWTFSFSYDYVIGNKFGQRTFSGYELSLYIKGNYKHKKYIPDPLRCPRFEQMMMPNEE